MSQKERNEKGRYIGNIDDEIEKKRMKSDIDEIAERIKRRKSGREMQEESKEDYYRDF